jgi:hypothetical protein
MRIRNNHSSRLKAQTRFDILSCSTSGDCSGQRELVRAENLLDRIPPSTEPIHAPTTASSSHGETAVKKDYSRFVKPKQQQEVARFRALLDGIETGFHESSPLPEIHPDSCESRDWDNPPSEPESIPSNTFVKWTSLLDCPNRPQGKRPDLPS